MAIRISHKGFQLLKQKTTGSSGGGSEEGIFTVTSIYPALNESIAVQFLFTSNLSDRTYYWTNGGSTTAADFEENLNAGSFVTTAGTGSVTFTLIQDRFTEGSETLLFQARNGSTGGAIIASSSLLVINDTSIGEYFVGSSGTEYTPSLAGLTAYAENTAITFTVTTTAADGTLYWTNGGTTNAADLVGNVNSGSFITTAGTGSVTLTARNDTLTEGNETLIFQVRTNNFGGHVVASKNVTIVDTSTDLYTITASATRIVEGSPVTFTFTTTGQNGSFTWELQPVGAPGGGFLPFPDASEFAENVLSGSFVTVAGTGSLTLNTLQDTLTEGDESFKFRVKSGNTTLVDSSTITIEDYYSMNASVSPVNEGSSVTFTFITKGPDGTFYWENDGTTTAVDFVENVSSGSFVTTAGTGSLVLTVRNDLLTEGAENIRIAVRSGGYNGTLLVRSGYVTVTDTSLNQYLITPSTTSINEGSAITFTFTTTGPNDTFNWQLRPVDAPGGGFLPSPEASDFVENVSSGSFVTTNGTGSLTLNVLQDNLTEGEESFKIRVTSTGGSTLADSTTITINDTSLSPFAITVATGSVNEGSAITFTVTTLSTDGTYYWTNGGTTTASDFVENVNNGSFIITSGTGSVTLTATNDLLTEGTETILFQLRTGSTGGSIVATKLVNVNDTSQTLYTMVPSSLFVNEGSAVTFTFTTTGPNASFNWELLGAEAPGGGFLPSPDASDFVENVSSGSFVTTNGTGSLTLNVLNDAIVDEETFKIRVKSGNTPVVDSAAVTIRNFYSLAASGSFNEGSPITFTFTTLGSDNTFYWTNGGTTTASDFVENVSSGSFVTTAGTGSVTLTPRNDLLTEGTENIIFQVRSGSHSGGILVSLTTNINDTSENVYTITSSASTIDEGSAITFTFTTTGLNGSFNWELRPVDAPGGGFLPYPDASDFVENVNSGSFITTAGTGSITLTLSLDNLGEEQEAFKMRVKSGTTTLIDSDPITINNTSGENIVIDPETGVTFALATSTLSVYEGSPITFNLTTTGPDSTFIWDLRPVGSWPLPDASDFVENATTGSFVTVNGTGSLVLTTKNETQIKDTEKFTLRIRSGSTTVGESPTIAIYDNYSGSLALVSGSLSGRTVNENTSFAVGFYGNLTNGTYFWENTGTTVGADFIDGFNTGSFLMTNGTGSINLSTKSDLLTEGTETIILQIKSGSQVIAIVPEIYVTDSSITQYSLSASTTTTNEGSPVIFTFTTSGPNGTFYWENIGTTTAADFVENTNSGSFVTTSGTGSITLNVKDDLLTDGTETINVRIRTGSVTGSIVASGSIVTVSDTSQTQYTVTSDRLTVDEGSSITFTVTTTGTDGTLYWTNGGTTTAADFNGNINSGSFATTSGTGSLTLTVASDELTENETFILQVREGSLSGSVVASSFAINIIDDTYTLSASAASIDEGSSVTFTFTTTDNDGTFYWINTGTSTGADFSDGAMSGSFVTTSGTGSFTRTLKNDLLTEGTETILMNVRAGSFSGSLRASASVDINDTSLTYYALSASAASVNEGSSVTFTFTTSRPAIVPGDVTWYWTNDGTSTGADFSDNQNSGVFIITNGTGSFTRTLKNDLLTEGSETILMNIRDGSTAGTIVASASVNINDTSLTQYALSSSAASVNEGSSVTFTFTTTGPDQTFYWINTGTSVGADFSDNSMSGSFATTSGTGSFTRTLVNDITTEGVETIIMNVRSGSYSGTIVASASVNVNDTSTYISNLSASAASVNEGSSVTFTFTTTGPNDTFYWTNSGTTSGADFSDSANSGSFTTTSGTGSFTRTLTNDVSTEGTETIIMNVRTGSYSGTVIASASVNVNDTSLSIVNLFTLTDPTSTNTTYNSTDLSNGISLTSTGAYTMTALTNFTASAKMWGGAGGANGGSGGFTNGTVGFVSGTNYVIWVGGGGRTSTINTTGYAGGFGGGGLVGRTNGTNANFNRGSGGGLTGLFTTSATQANAILIAGGGGGGGGTTDNCLGGNGGGLTGNSGSVLISNSATSGLGGTQVAGGSAGGSGGAYGGFGVSSGSALTGGRGATDTSTTYTGAGGGGGYFGGGGGGNNNTVGAAGGGGSGFVSSTLAVTGSTERHATRGTVPQSGDANYVSGRAAPSNSTTSGGTSGAGLFVFVPQL